MTHGEYKFLVVIRIFGQFKAGAKTHAISQCIFFLERNRISFITKILAADELRSHVTITLRDKSRYDLIVKINEKA